MATRGLRTVAVALVVPMTNVTVALSGAFDTAVSVVVNASEDYSLSATLPVPSDLEPGTYKVIASIEGAQSFLDSETVRVREP